MINGSFGAIGAPPPYMTPPYRAEDYAGIYSTPPSPGIRPSWTPPAPSAFSPYMTPAERATLDQQIAASKSLQNDVTNGLPWGVPNHIDLAAMEKYGSPKSVPAPAPPSWTTIGPLLAQAAFRQNAFQKTNQPPAPALAAPVPTGNTPWGQLSQQLFQQLLARAGRPPTAIPAMTAKTTPAQSYSLVNALSQATAGGATGVGTNGYTYVNGVNVGYSPEVQAQRAAQGQAIAEANRRNPNPTYTVSGDRNDFQPRSVQESTRWQTGY